MAERQVEIHHNGVEHDVACNRPGDIVGDGGGADATLGANHGKRATDRIGIGRGENAGHRADDILAFDRRDQIVGDAATDQVAIELHVVETADDDHLGAGIAAFRQPVEAVEQFLAHAGVLDQHHVRRRRIAIGFQRRGDAAGLELEMCLRHAAIFSGNRNARADVVAFAERLNRHPRNVGDVIVL